jgi:hypothetical protein
MGTYITTPSPEEFKKGVNHAYKIGITDIANRKLDEKFWQDYKEETLLFVEDDTIYYGKTHKGVEAISIDEFLKYEKRKE